MLQIALICNTNYSGIRIQGEKIQKKEGRYEGLRPSGDAGEPALKK